MKILHLRASNFYGGPERQIHIHARLAMAAGYDMTVSSFSEKGEMPEFLKVINADGIKVHLFCVRSAYDLKAIKTVRHYIRENHFDILCTHDYRTHLIAFRAVSGTSCKWVAFSRGWTRDTLRVKLYGVLDKLFIRFADHIVAVSGAQKRSLEKLAIPRNKISVVYNAINPDEMLRCEVIDLRRRYSLPSHSIIVIAAGRFSREKGQIYLVEAARVALKENSHLRFILFGDGPDFGIIQQLANKYNLTEIIILPGFEKNLMGCLRGADILVNSSLSEGLPNIVLEGMALGIPAVATAVGGVPELIQDRQSGLLVPAYDADALARAIVEAAEDNRLRQEMATNAREVILHSFSFAEQLQRLRNIYDRIAGGEMKGAS